jgi:hypothetical protein
MNGYLLLRDNKQSGPYSLEEMIAKGFKPYDLIWAEGKSAGWRYPSEFLEFSAFAPVIEEQPYDRFYKKPGSPATTESVNYAAAASKPESAVASISRPVAPIAPAATVAAEAEKPIAPPKTTAVPPRKIFVTLPGNAAAQAAPSPAAKAEPAPKKEVPQTANEYIAAAEKEMKAAAAAQSPTPTYTSFKQSERFLADRPQAAVKEETLYVPQPAKRNSLRTFTTAAVAACLLLGGVIIGLVISNNKQSADQEKLNSIVKQIQERKTNGATTPVQTDAQQQPPSTPLVTPSDNNVSSPVTNPDDTKGNDNNANAGDREIARQAVNKELPKTTDQTKVVTTVQKEEPVAAGEKDVETARQRTEDIKSSPVTEKARQNIYQLVSVAGSDYKTGLLGGISNLQLTVSNNSLYAVDQVEVLVNYLNVEKKLVKQQTVVVSDVAAGEQKTIDVPKTNRGVYVSYTITKINSRALGVAHSGL